MNGKELHLSGGAGLSVMVAGEVADPAFSWAAVYVGTEQRCDISDDGVVIAVSVSSARLRTILYRTPLGEVLASDASRSGGLQVLVKNSTLVRRVAKELRETPYTDGSLKLFLHGKIIELLVAGLWEVEHDEPASVVEAASNLLLADPFNPPTVAELASKFGVSPRILCGQFKALFGMTVSDWLTEQRLGRAKEMVVGGSIPLAEIATLVGYAHLSNFSSAFSKRFGMPPARMRSSSRQLDQTNLIARTISASSRVVSTNSTEILATYKR